MPGGAAAAVSCAICGRTLLVGRGHDALLARRHRVPRRLPALPGARDGSRLVSRRRHEPSRPCGAAPEGLLRPPLRRSASILRLRSLSRSSAACPPTSSRSSRRSRSSTAARTAARSRVSCAASARLVQPSTPTESGDTGIVVAWDISWYRYRVIARRLRPRADGRTWLRRRRARRRARLERRRRRRRTPRAESCTRVIARNGGVRRTAAVLDCDCRDLLRDSP